ncbi:hypothetical protein DYBT9275_05622 [Dyadobacter sp. CECT 9275]|uniref:T9SS type A sorting domain-containing protein n=1 Tax=Dyadobacter helix TaxID=2822344 RepID=A0A916JI72_9BACT|nr:M43 family zinc metalloprotease [Dyadobacter sp. CECT 9275]CAG5016731.1 hypothetical protein DYBT9275_05622 [Dyadobacter sp. CECT 9275]
MKRYTHVKLIRKLLPVFFLLIWSNVLKAQEKCGSMLLLENRFKTQPSLKILYDQEEFRFQQQVSQRIKSGASFRTTSLVTIPVVFHIVVSRQSNVTDAQVMAQLDTINKDYAGINGGASRIPSYFKDLFGQSGIQFCLAQRTPDNQPSTGIVRYTTSSGSFNYLTENVKHAATGGADAWDTSKYLNIWICSLSGGILGYSSFPGQGADNEKGVVVDYNSLPGANNQVYNQGKTLTHEIGHFFSLRHIWGDDEGACTGSDNIDDTPNQSNSTATCATGVVTDRCTPASPGIMYQNFMDYSPDNCLLMFTKMQVARMEAAYNSYYSLMASSNGCLPVDLKNNDSNLKSVTSPEQRLCQDTFVPTLILRNNGLQALRSVNIYAKMDNGTTLSYSWTGNLATFAETTVNLSQFEVGEGDHILTVYTASPNGVQDEDTSNDEKSVSFIYYAPFPPPVVESFENTFPPAGWDIVNPDGLTSWEKTTVAAKTGSASARIHNYEYSSIGQKDYLRSPNVNIAGVDSAFVSFQLAAATYTSTNSQSTQWDTLQVLISTDCGKTYTSIYKKWGANLITRSAATRIAFTPAQNEWRKEEINIGSYINSGNILIAFMNTTANENDIYLDDINIRTVTVNPNLKEAGFLVTPNPTEGDVSVQFYPHPEDLQAIYIYNVSGQKVAERVISGAVSTNIYDFDMRYASAGLYIVKAVFAEKVLTKKFVKTR